MFFRLPPGRAARWCARWCIQGRAPYPASIIPYRLRVWAAMLLDKVGEAGAEPKAFGPLPEWDLRDLYPGRDSPELRRDLEALASDAASFRARYEGKLASLSGGELGEAVAEYERMQETAGRIMSYADLTRAGNVADPAI